MLRAVKYVALVALCLLVVGGAAGMRVYVLGCAKSHHEARISLTETNSCCCRAHVHDATCEHDTEAEGNALAAVDGTCCTTVSQVFNVSSFAVSQLLKLDKITTTVFTANLLIDNALRFVENSSRAAYSSLVHAPPSPDIFSFGQLRL